MEILKSSYAASTRRKRIQFDDLEPNKLQRCLSAWELTFFGVGTTIGPGLYVISGEVARDTAGPGVVASFAIAALACLFSAVCYAEFAVRLPRSGSSYTYCYATVGEMFGFVVGWNVIFENILGFSVVAKAWSQYLDSFMNNTMKHNMQATLLPGYGPVYFDVVAFGLVIIFMVVVIVGAHVTSTANTAFTIVNILVCFIIVGFGAFYANSQNWKNFAPFGITGILKGSGKCFYAMMGFDVVATTCEETEDKKTVPKAMLLTLFVCFILYVSTSAILTLMVPYDQIDISASFPKAFEYVGASWANYVIAIGAISSLSASLLGGLYASARITYSMAIDGLVFQFLGTVSEALKTPVYSTIVVGVFGAFMALIFDLGSLVEMMSIGTLMAYSGVSASVLILRYQHWTIGYTAADSLSGNLTETDAISDKATGPSYGALVTEPDSPDVPKTTPSKPRRQPTERTGELAKNLTALFCIFVMIGASFIVYGQRFIEAGAIWAITIAILFIVLAIIVGGCFWLLPKNETKLHFTVPAMPLWCLVSLALNLSIMMTLSPASWLRVCVWILFGLCIYYGYGVRHSTENRCTTVMFEDDGSEKHELLKMSEPSSMTTEEPSATKTDRPSSSQ